MSVCSNKRNANSRVGGDERLGAAMTGGRRNGSLRLLVLVVGLALVVFLFFRGLDFDDPLSLPDNEESARVLAAELIASIAATPSAGGDNPELLRLVGNQWSQVRRLADALTGLADQVGDDRDRVRRAFAALGRGDPAPAVTMLGERAAQLKDRLAAYDGVPDAEIAIGADQVAAFAAASEAVGHHGALLRLVDRDAALAAFREQARLANDPADGWMAYGHIALHMGALEEAFDAYDRAVTLVDPYEDRALTALAMGTFALVGVARGDLNSASAFQYEAIRMAEELEDAPRVAVAYSHLGMIQLAAGDIERAAISFAVALEIETGLGRGPGIARAHRDLAVVYERHGDRRLACENWGHGAAIEADLAPSDPAIHQAHERLREVCEGQ